MIAHIDMDAFYAAVEVLDDPSLRGRPVIVGGNPDSRSVVSAASYEAREFGVHSAMPVATARRLCPHAVFLPGRMKRYAAISKRIFQIMKGYSPLVEPLSLDEAFMDLTGTERLLGDPVALARRIKRHIKSATGLVASVGLAPSKFVAKLTSDLGKPDGFVVVRPDEVRRVLDPLPVTRMWGVGPSTLNVLSGLGIETIGDLARYPARLLASRLGPHAHALQQRARGEDSRRVVPAREAKSYSHEVTFARDEGSMDRLCAVLCRQAEAIAIRLRRDGVRGRTVTLKARFPGFVTVTRSRSLHEYFDHGPVIFRLGTTLLEGLRLGGKPLRLIGLGVSGIREKDQAPCGLFDLSGREEERLDHVLDSLRDRFGDRVVEWGTTGL